jgi:hypothetical protein
MFYHDLLIASLPLIDEKGILNFSVFDKLCMGPKLPSN